MLVFGVCDCKVEGEGGVEWGGKRRKRRRSVSVSVYVGVVREGRRTGLMR